MLEILLAYKYPLLFFGILIIGMPVLIPSLVLAVEGKINLLALSAIVLAVTIVSDSIWYMVGRSLSFEKLKRWRIFRKREQLFHKLAGYMHDRGVTLLFLSRFLYGLKVVIETLAGMHRMRYRTYVLTNIASSILWLAVALGLLQILHTTAGSFTNTLYGTRIALTVLVLIAFAVDIIARKYFETKWMKKI